MIEALFNQSNYVAAKKSLDAIALRQEAIASNLANLETPGYRRVDLQPNFADELQRACASGDAQRIAGLNPKIAADPNAVARSPDGNTVSLEEELMELNQNTLEHSLEAQLVTGSLLKLKMAITGRAS